MLPSMKNHPEIPLPILHHRDAIIAAIAGSTARAAIVSAPPGSGKSTCVPAFFLDVPDITGEIVVLQPRRIAARQLAAWVARARNDRAGGTVGYRVRFDSRTGPRTRLVFETYGVFVRQMLANPRARGIGLVVLDEFHERTLDADLSLAWLRRLQEESPAAPPVIVMSATLDEKELSAFLPSAPLVHAPGRVHPVAVEYQAPRPRESIEDQAVRALGGLLTGGFEDSALIFMPGAAEIRRTADLAAGPCRARGFRVFELHGRLSLDEQTAALDAARSGRCVIVATNVAETSLTIPGVTAVIDSGYERRAAYDPDRDRNTLFRAFISAGSATQRAGRAGRIAPGRCIRLWNSEAGRSMAESVPPEITRLELSAVALSAIGLCARAGIAPRGSHALAWPTAPDPQRWRQAMALLADIGAVARSGAGALTSAGDRLLEIPAAPLPARIMIDSQECGLTLLSAAMIALWEADDRRLTGTEDVFDAAFDLVAGNKRRIDPAIVRAADALCEGPARAKIDKERSAVRTALDARDDAAIGRLHAAAARCWLPTMRRRIGVCGEEGAAYTFGDGTIAVMPSDVRQRPEALIALNVLHSAGAGKSRVNRITQYFPLRVEWIDAAFTDEIRNENECRWDDKKQAVIGERRRLLGGLVLSRTVMPGAQADADAAAGILAGKLLDGEIELRDDEVRQFVYRCRCVAAAAPSHGFPLFSADDWRLVFHDFAHGKSSRKELEGASLLAAVKEYAGAHRLPLLERLAPAKFKLPSGKAAKVLYAEHGPPEVSARITDFIGFSGRFTVCDGRVAGNFNILAPNYRTVQKTADLAGFWRNTYPGLKNGLQRKYPRHPWP